MFRLTDLCGMRSAVSATNGVLSLAATRFPAYVSGLDGLKADILARPRGEIKARVPSDDEDMTAFRLAANPHGSEMTFWVRNIAVLKGPEKAEIPNGK